MNTRSTTLRAVLLVLVAAAAGFSAFQVTRERHAASARAVPADAAPPAAVADGDPRHVTAGDAAAGEPPPPAPRPIPDRLPDIALRDREGVLRHLSHWRDQPLMVNFWATWCGPCRREIPLLKQLRRERSAERLEVVGIAVDERPAVLDYARTIGIDYPVLIGEQEGMDAAAAFGMDTVFPFTIFADRQQRIVAAKIGELHADEAAYILDRVRDIDTGRLALAAARTLIGDRLRELAVARAQHEVK